MPDDTEDQPLNPLEPIGDTKLPTAPGIAAVALALAMKFHDINTVQDGTLYQQYKLEGRNMEALHLDMVFETAIKIEVHLLASSDRIARIVIDAVTKIDEGDATPEKQLDEGLQ